MTDEEEKPAKKKSVRIIVESAEWCEPCVELKKRLEKYKEDVKDKYDVIITEIEPHTGASASYIPRWFVISKCKASAEQAGAPDEEELKAKVERLIDEVACEMKE